MPIPAILAVAGPTGAGKSSLSLALAERFGGEVVNFDSVQVYAGFDIGSAKLPLALFFGINAALLCALSVVFAGWMMQKLIERQVRREDQA